jgi:hypothetical protein
VCSSDLGIRALRSRLTGKAPGIKKFDDLSRICSSEIVFEDKFIRNENYMLGIEVDAQQM